MSIRGKQLTLAACHWQLERLPWLRARGCTWEACE
jgi:hypothetical protein